MPIYKLKDGKYRINVNYKDPITGEYKQKTKRGIKTKSEAMQFEAQLLIEVNKSPDQQQKEFEQNILDRMTLSDLFDDYFAAQLKVLKKTTLRSTTQVFKTHIDPYFGARRLKSIILIDFRNWKNSIDDYISPKTMQLLKLSAKKSIYKKLNTLLNYAYKNYGYMNNILPRLGDFKSVDIVEDKVHYWTIEQFCAFISAVEEDCRKNNKWSLFVIFNILFFCGLRKGEANALTWKDIVSKGNYQALHVRRSLSQKVRNDDGSYYISSPKNKSSNRFVPLSKLIEQILNDHYARSKNDIVNFSDEMFIAGGISPVSDTRLDEAKNYYADRVGIPRIKIHDFRHSFVTLLINANVNIKTISALVGHSTVDQTWNTYGHLYPEATNQAIEFLNKLVDMKSTKSTNNNNSFQK